MSIAPPPDLVGEIANHPLFAGLDPKLVRSAASTAQEREFAAGDLLAREGTTADTLLLILRGKVALEVGAADRPTLTVQTVGPGEVVGWSWFVPPFRWRFDARAVKPTRAIVLNGPALRETLSRHPAWGFAFLVRFLPLIAERLENTRIQLLDIHAR